MAALPDTPAQTVEKTAHITRLKYRTNPGGMGGREVYSLYIDGDPYNVVNVPFDRFEAPSPIVDKMIKALPWLMELVRIGSESACDCDATFSEESSNGATRRTLLDFVPHPGAKPLLPAWATSMEEVITSVTGWGYTLERATELIGHNLSLWPAKAEQCQWVIDNARREANAKAALKQVDADIAARKAKQAEEDAAAKAAEKAKAQMITAEKWLSLKVRPLVYYRGEFVANIEYHPVMETEVNITTKSGVHNTPAQVELMKRTLWGVETDAKAKGNVVTQRVMVVAHFKRELKSDGINYAWHAMQCLGTDIPGGIEKHGLSGCIDRLQAYLEREPLPMAKKTETASEQAWYDVPENLATVKTKLADRAKTLNIPDDQIIAQAMNDAGDMKKFAKGGEFIAAVIRKWEDKIAAQMEEATAEDADASAEDIVDIGQDEHTVDVPSEPTKMTTTVNIPSANGNPFKPATFDATWLRMALVGPSGSGKTYTALNIATNLVPNGKVALIDTERGSASKYAKLFKFDVLELRNYHPDTYVKAVKAAVDYGYNVLVIDSLTHAWNADGGILSIVDKKGGGFDKWKDVNPILWRLINTILDSQIHVISTMRVKTDYIMEVNERTGKQTPKKVGLAPVMKDQIEYEFDVYGEIELDSTLTISKSRCPALNAAVYPKAGEEVAGALRNWLMGN